MGPSVVWALKFGVSSQIWSDMVASQQRCFSVPAVTRRLYRRSRANGSANRPAARKWTEQHRALSSNPSARIDHPLRLVELSDDGDLAVLRGFHENCAHCLVPAPFHLVPRGLGFPAGDREQNVGIANLAV